MSDPIRPPELSELETFVLAVDEGSIARAGARLRISAPAAAKRIRQLEVLAHAPLLNRGRRGVSATEAGQRLYPIARELIARRAEAVAALSGKSRSDPLRIAGVHQLLGRAPLPPRDEVVRDTQALLAAIFHATGEGIVLTRAKDGLIYEVNDAAARMLGYEHGELRGRSVSDIGLWAEPNRRETIVREAITTRNAQQAELVVRDRSGTTRTVLARFEAVELHGLPYMLLTIRDVSRSPDPRPAGTPARSQDGVDDELSARYLDALRHGQAELAVAAAEEALECGANLASVHSHLIDPAMKTIGELWEGNVITVAEEHLATEISQRAAARVYWKSLNGNARSHGRVVMAAVQGEHHVLGLRLAADVLETGGFDVLYLGADLPLDALLHACRAYEPEVLGLTVSMPLNIATLVWELDEVAKLSRPPRVVIGGRAAEAAIRDGLGAAYVRRSDEVLEVFNQLLPPSGSPVVQR